jgi:hypothetical protein
MTATGGWLTWKTVTRKVWAAEVSWPPWVVPPLSCRRTVIVAVPWALGAGVKVSVPSGAIAGGMAKSDAWSFVTWNASVWAVYSGGPGLIARPGIAPGHLPLSCEASEAAKSGPMSRIAPGSETGAPGAQGR